MTFVTLSDALMKKADYKGLLSNAEKFEIVNETLTSMVNSIAFDPLYPALNRDSA